MKSKIAKNTQDMIFVTQIFDSGSIASACKTAGLERTTLSRRLKALEERVGVSLFDRSGQCIKLTDVGSAYLKYCYRVRELAEEAESCITGQSMPDFNTLFVLADFEEAGSFLAPVADDFSKSNSGADVVISLLPRPLMKIPDDADLVIQIGGRRQPGIQTHELAMLSRSLWAAPEFLEHHELADNPRVVEELPCIGMSDATDGAENWQLIFEQRTFTVRVLPRFRVPSLVACREACISGLGIANLPDYLCGAALRSGKLRRVLASWCPSALRLTASHHRGGQVRSRIRSFIELCKARDFNSATSVRNRATREVNLSVPG